MSTSLADRIVHLDSCNPTAIAACAVEVARAAASRNSPRKAIALVKRHATDRGASPDIVRQVLEMADAELTRIGEQSSVPVADPPRGVWLTVEATANALNESVARVKERLRTADGRRRLGWPWWDGRAWRIPEPAINPLTRPSYMAVIPVDEPPPHAATLPVWCDR